MAVLTPVKKFEILQKHAKYFAMKKGSSRPILEGVYFDPDGSAYVTNSHYALLIQDVHSYEDPFISSAHDGKKIEGLYPDLKKIFIKGKKEAKKIAIIKRDPYDNSFKPLKKFLKAVSDLTSDPAEIRTDDGRLLLHAKSCSVELKFFFDCDFYETFSASEPLSFYLNPNYLFHVIDVFMSAESETLDLLMKDDIIFISDEEKRIDTLIVRIARRNKKD